MLEKPLVGLYIGAYHLFMRFNGMASQWHLLCSVLVLAGCSVAALVVLWSFDILTWILLYSSARWFAITWCKAVGWDLRHS